MSSARAKAGIFSFSACAIVSTIFMMHSCNWRLDVNPFFPRDKTISLIFFSRLSRAFEIILKMEFNNDIGLQFFILEMSPFFGISLIPAELNDCVDLDLFDP
jgi:hypothetical protein